MYLHGDEAVGLHPGVRSSLDVSLQPPPKVLEHGRPSRQHNVLEKRERHKRAQKGTKG